MTDSRQLFPVDQTPAPGQWWMLNGIAVKVVHVGPDHVEYAIDNTLYAMRREDWPGQPDRRESRDGIYG